MSDCDKEGCVAGMEVETEETGMDRHPLSLQAEDFDFDPDNFDVSEWEIVFALGQKFLAKVRMIAGRMGVPVLVLWPVLDYASKTAIAKDGKLEAKRQAAPIELMASLSKIVVPVALAGRNPISSYEAEDQETFREMILGALVDLRKSVREARGQQPRLEPRVALASAVPQHLAGRMPPEGRGRR